MRKTRLIDQGHLQIIFHELVDLHYGCLVTTAVAVVRCREDRHYVSFVSPVVPVHDQLMGACDSSQVIRVVKLLRDILSEAITSTSGTDAPTASIIWVRPKEIADWSLVGSLLDAVQLADLIEGVNAW